MECGDGAGMGASEWGSLEHRTQAVSPLGIELTQPFSDRTLTGSPGVEAPGFNHRHLQLRVWVTRVPT